MFVDEVLLGKLLGGVLIEEFSNKTITVLLDLKRDRGE